MKYGYHIVRVEYSKRIFNDLFTANVKYGGKNESNYIFNGNKANLLSLNLLFDLISEPQERRNKHLKYTFSELKIRNFQIPQKLLKFAIFTNFTSEIGLRILL